MMLHAIRHLEEEMRKLIGAWQGLRVSVVLNDALRSTMERQTAAEIMDVQEALGVLRSRASVSSRMSKETVALIEHILTTRGVS